MPHVAVAAWLGHTMVTVTHNYQHVMAERLAEASWALGVTAIQQPGHCLWRVRKPLSPQTPDE